MDKEVVGIEKNLKDSIEKLDKLIANKSNAKAEYQKWEKKKDRIEQDSGLSEEEKKDQLSKVENEAEQLMERVEADTTEIIEGVTEFIENMEEELKEYDAAVKEEIESREAEIAELEKSEDPNKLDKIKLKEDEIAAVKAAKKKVHDKVRERY